MPMFDELAALRGPGLAMHVFRAPPNLTLPLDPAAASRL